MTTAVRAAEPGELPRLARIWFDAWREAHLALVPEELTRLRTLEDFERRLREVLSEIRVAGPPDRPLGFCVIKQEELDQLFVAPEARGTGAAAALLADGEDRLRERGVELAWLTCAIGNHRAAHFYEKHGWVRAATVVTPAPTSDGTFALEVWRYEKRLAPAGRESPR